MNKQVNATSQSRKDQQIKAKKEDEKSVVVSYSKSLEPMTNEELFYFRAALEVEMRKRKLAFSVGEFGERLAIEYFRHIPGLPKLQLAPRGTKNVDALSRNGDRYSIKTICNAKKTGTIYPDPENKEKQLFEYLLIVKMKEDWALSSIHQLTWAKFVEVRSWDKRMNAWYVGCSEKTFASATRIYSAGAIDQPDGANTSLPNEN